MYLYNIIMFVYINIYTAPHGHPLCFPMLQEGPNLSAVRFTKAPTAPTTAPTTAPPTEPLNLDSATRQLEQLVQVWGFTWEIMENSGENKKMPSFFFRMGWNGRVESFESRHLLGNEF